MTKIENDLGENICNVYIIFFCNVHNLLVSLMKYIFKIIYKIYYILADPSIS